MPVSILHIADSHIGSVVSAFSPDKNIIRNREIEYTLVNTLKNAHSYDIVLMSGDIFDSPSAPIHLADMVLNAIASCSDTRFFYACGNHDPYISPVIDHCVRNCPDNLHIFGPEFPEYVTLPELGACVCGISFAQSHQTEPLLASLTPCDESLVNILCVHGELTEGDNAIYNPISLPLSEQAGFDYLALGHVHSFSGIEKFGRLHYAYPGVPEPRGFDECGPKGCICGTVSKGDIRLKFSPLARREYVDDIIDISDVSDFAGLVTKTNRAIASNDNIYRITLCGANNMNSIIQTDHLMSFCDSFHISISDATTMALNLEDYACHPTLKGECARQTLSMMVNCEDSRKEHYKKACALLFELFDSKGAKM